jgi:hypothetical protein
MTTATMQQSNINSSSKPKNEEDDELPTQAAKVQAQVVRICPYEWGSPVDEVLEVPVPVLSLSRPQEEHDNDNGNDQQCQAGQQEHDNDNRFDIVVAADCIYMPAFHDLLLDSIDLLLLRNNDKHNTAIPAVAIPIVACALVPFALHGNTPDASVWAFVDKAQMRNFHVQQLTQAQLTPQSLGMDSKRALVHTLRLTRM